EPQVPLTHMDDTIPIKKPSSKIAGRLFSNHFLKRSALYENFRASPIRTATSYFVAANTCMFVGSRTYYSFRRSHQCSQHYHDGGLHP
ncbi:hypothetical protein, partial [Dysosmobacter welbionis]|uniref:hypothetical protein n=1 Tax=Dysosmobacter welbionis TaxID=2093857 RepID=UPI003A903E10